jgi:hypothetical protein
MKEGTGPCQEEAAAILVLLRGRLYGDSVVCFNRALQLNKCPRQDAQNAVLPQRRGSLESSFNRSTISPSPAWADQRADAWQCGCESGECGRNKISDRAHELSLLN